jgi:hypothetical protein
VTHRDLLTLARDFAEEVDELVSRCFSNSPAIEVDHFESRLSIHPEGQRNLRQGGIPLNVNGKRLAWLRISYLCRFDATETFLAVDSSSFSVVAEVDKTPVFRFEYLYQANNVPHSHIHVHGQRGALSHLLSKSGHEAPHEMSKLHIPTGGSRFRPNLEDVIQFLIAECKFQALPDWKDAIDDARARWRAIQTRAVARAMPGEAAAQLESMGYKVTPPAGGHPDPGRKARFSW